MTFIGIKLAIGQPIISGAPFSNNQSALLDGVDEFINIDAVKTALASTTVGTWIFWVKPVDSTPTSTERLICFGDTNANTSIRLSLLSTGQIDYQVRLTGTIEWTLRTDAAALSSGVWEMIAITNNVTPKIYIGSSLVAQTDLVSNNNFWFNDLSGLDNGRIGTLNHNSGGEAGHFNGNVTKPLFINRELTQPQIANINNSGTPKDESGIANGVSYFLIDGDIVPTMVDQIGSNNGTYVNMEQADIENDAP